MPAVSKERFHADMLCSTKSSTKEAFESEFALRQIDGIIANFKHFSRSLEDDNSNIVISPSSPLICQKKHATTSKSLGDLSMRSRRVSFADDHGLKLVSVKYVQNSKQDGFTNFIRTITDHNGGRCSTCYSKVCGCISPKNGFHTISQIREPCITATFSDPVLQPNFMNIVRTQKVSLESVVADSRLAMATCTVRVQNIGFSKMVFARYTLDSWETYFDAHADFVHGWAFEEESDRFKFVLFLPSGFTGSTIEFAICFRCNGHEYWDNNDKENYKLVVQHRKI